MERLLSQNNIYGFLAIVLAIAVIVRQQLDQQHLSGVALRLVGFALLLCCEERRHEIDPLLWVLQVVYVRVCRALQ